MTRMIALGTAALLLLGGAFVASRDAAAPGTALPFAAQAQEGGAATSADPSQIAEMSLGQAEAPVEVIEYASFTCPHCRTFHEGPFQQLKADYIDTGKVHFIYREVYFDRFGLWAAMLARCGGEDRYFGIADLLFEQQEQWTAGDPSEIAGNLRRLGKTAGLEDAQIEACLGDAAQAEAMVALYQQNVERDDISSTPSFIIDGQKYSNMDYAEFSSVIDEKLGDDAGQ